MPLDEQHRLQQFNQTLSGRNLQQPSLSTPAAVSGSDRGHRMVPGGNAMGVSGMNRNTPMSRPGFQGMASSAMPNTGSMLSSGMVEIPNTGNIHSGGGASQGNSMIRPREAVQHMMRVSYLDFFTATLIITLRFTISHMWELNYLFLTSLPGLIYLALCLVCRRSALLIFVNRWSIVILKLVDNITTSTVVIKTDIHEFQMQAAQGNSPGIPAFSNLSSGFTNQTTPVQAYPGHLSQQHQMSPQSHVLGNSHHPHLQSPSQATGAQQEAFAIRQRQIHQRYLQQQQQQFPASGSMMPHVQQPQGSSVSSSSQNSPQTQPPVSPQPLSMPPVSPSPNINAMAQQKPQKSQLALHGLGRSPQSGTSGVNNQAGKQRQRQLQQSARQHPHQRQPTQGQQLNKQLKGMGRGNMIHQNITVDQSHLNGLTMPQGNQATEKGEIAVPVRPDQQSSVGTTTSTNLQSKPFVSPLSSNHSQQLPKSFPGALSPSPQQQMQLHSDNSIQGQSSPATPCNILSTSSLSIAPAVAPSNHQHLLIHQKQRNQVQSTAQRVVQHNHLGNSELSKKSQAECMPRVPQSVTNTTQTVSMGTTKGMPQASNDLKNIKAVGSTAVPALEPPSCVASVQSTASKVVNNSNTDSAGNDPVSTPNQGLAQKHGIKGVTQRQQQSLPSEEKRPKLPEKPTVQNQKHLASEEQPHLEEAQELSSSKPPDTKVE